ncbi:hypothetical protein OHC50_00865 [Paenarthrobacter ilicis]|uniref:Uncharacterized protein n=1 Tax=Paenarthrobacter nicotinovorans TaxID=29320 RepID=A0ABV0GYI8_PAENI|nr:MULTISPECIES: hypothetical protein [Paenarthrobacter]
MTLHNYPEWIRLQGAVVQIRRDDHVIATGTVEDAMHDSSILWLAAEGLQLRRMYVAAEGYTAWVEPMLLAGDAAYRMTASRLYG